MIGEVHETSSYACRVGTSGSCGIGKRLQRQTAIRNIISWSCYGFDNRYRGNTPFHQSAGGTEFAY